MRGAECGEGLGGVLELGLGGVEVGLEADELGVAVVPREGPFGAAALELGGEELLVGLEGGDGGGERLELEKVGVA